MKNALGLALALSLLALPGRVRAEESVEKVGEELVAAMEEMATIVDKDKANCDTMAGDLSGFADKNAPLFQKAKGMKDKSTPDQQKAWKEKYQQRMSAVMQKMMPGLQACGKNDKVKAALGKLDMKK